MKKVTFITGNRSKADYLARYLEHEVDHVKLDLDEIQSLDLETIVEHKVRQAYDQIKKPVLVDDVSLEFAALGRLPGPFIKWFLGELDMMTLISLLDGKDKTATGRCCLGFYDGQQMKIIQGSISGKIADKPAGSNGFGWDKIFIPDGYNVTRAQLNDEDYHKVYLQIRPFSRLKEFLESQGLV